ncbi:MAG: TetR family transcriptional regulator [Xanthomonadales bacterium]|nr:TetR family transcriptional regulator [Xanthomonadales bacterium]
MKKPLTPVRAQKKHRNRNALIEAGNRRFHQFGYESTTIDDICADAGISRRSFFRYFPSKEALAFPQRAERLAHFRALLRGNPTESPFATLRRIAKQFADAYTAHRESLIAQQELIQTSPALLATEHDIDREWEEALEEEFLLRLGDVSDAALRAKVTAGALIGVIRATLRYWFDQGGEPDLARLGAAAIDALERGFIR